MAKKKPKKRSPSKKGRPAPLPKKRRVIRPHKPTKREREKLRRERISAALKAFHSTKKTIKERKKETRKKLPKLPKGFGSLDPRPDMNASLARAGVELYARWGVESEVRSAVNADKSIAYELRIVMTPSARKDPQRFLTDLTNSIQSVPGTWSTIGFRFRPKKITEEEREKYDRHKGTIQIQAYTQRTSSRHLVRLEATAEQILDNVKERKGWIPDSCFVRMFWHKHGERPSRNKNLKR